LLRIDAVQKAAALDPNSVEAAVRLATLLDVAGQKQMAVASYRRAVQLQPNNAVALNNLAYLLSETGGSL
jgi:Flp pilus assembly protein TadD